MNSRSHSTCPPTYISRYSDGYVGRDRLTYLQETLIHKSCSMQMQVDMQVTVTCVMQAKHGSQAMN